MAGLVFAAPAVASCSPPKVASTWDAFNGVFYYIDAGADGVVGSEQGAWWQLGNYAAANDGGAPVSNFFYFYAGDATLGAIVNDMGAYVNNGCPGGSMIHTIEVTTTGGGAKFAAMTVNESPGAPLDFDYTTYGSNTSLVTIPRPRVTASSRVTTNVNLTISIDSAAAGTKGPSASGAVAGFRVLSASAASDPGRLASAYGVRATAASAGGAAVAGVAASVDCANTANDQWVVTQIQYADGQFSELVSAPTRVECDPNLADPGRFKIIDKQKKKGESLSPR